MRKSGALRTLAFLAAVAASAPAQEPPILDLLVERLAVYLSEYEHALSAVVADETYEQQQNPRSLQGGGAQVKTLVSEVAFLRLPGGAEWYGIRDVKRVNGKAVKGAGITLGELLKHPGTDFFDRAISIVEASSEHNLGGPRTINMPTVPLEALSAANHPRYIFKLRGNDRVSGVETRRLDFEEFDEPTLVHGIDGGSLWSRGSAWLAGDTGRLWRAELIVGPDRPGSFRRVQLESRVRVDFVHDATLNLLVPNAMTEEFWIPRGRGNGKARYSNFRRFATAGRVVPPRADR
jgi:hypothetical protein